MSKEDGQAKEHIKEAQEGGMHDGLAKNGLCSLMIEVDRCH